MKNLKNISKKTILIILGIVVGASASIYAAATWQGTKWIKDGSVISSNKMSNNFNYLYEKDIKQDTKINNLISELNSRIDKNCIIKKEKATCTVNTPYSCNCGKAGCATCTKKQKGSGDRLKVECPGSKPIIGPIGTCHVGKHPYSCNCSKYGCKTCWK